MKMLLAFINKELLEQWKNYKIMILFSALAIFGMTSPVLAKMMPDIFSQTDMGFTISIPEATYIDAYAQFFKNMTQICMMLVILIFSTNITQELQKGSAIIMFSKGLPRTTFIAAKFIAAVLIWTVGYVLSAAFFYGYTAFLFPSQSPQNVVLSMVCLWVLVVFVLSILTVTSVISSQSYVPLLLTAGIMALQLVINTFSNIARYSPLALGTYNMELITGVKSINDVYLPLAIAAGLTILCISAAIAVFRRRQL